MMASAWAQNMLRACDSDKDWPPFLYQEGAKAPLEGFGLKLMEAAAQHAGYTLSLTRKPWPRCLAEAASGQFDLVLTASASPEREAVFLRSRPLFSVTPGFVYRRSETAKLRLESPADLRRYRVCAVIGTNVAALGLDSSEIDLSAFDLDAVMEKITSGRCDLAPIVLEPFAATRFRNGIDYAHDPNFRVVRARWHPRAFYYAMVPRMRPDAAGLRDALDMAIGRMMARGEYERLAARYHLPIKPPRE
jgi:polar amino acid transport system substrate-binding protein